MNRRVPRREVLKGIGAAVALPTLESGLGLSPLVQSAEAPKRLAFLFVPNGVHYPEWKPTATGADYELTSILEPLAPVKKNFSVLTGLAQRNAAALGDGPGDHARSAAAWLTGVHPKKTAGSDISVGISADQVAAEAVGGATKFRSLELGCERSAMAGNCDSGYSCAYSSSVSWRGPTTPVAKETSPRLVFERDFVLEDAKGLSKKLGAKDQMKLDEYLTSVREIEQRLDKVETAEAQQVLAAATAPGRAIPRDRGEHIRLMGDMMILALQADLTRVTTFMFANEGSNRPYREINISEGHHSISHHGNEKTKVENKRRIDRYHVEQLAYILGQMDAIEDVNGSLLDNSMVVYGGGISDGNRHNHNDLPILLAGKAGGKMKQGQHYQFAPNTPMNNLYLSLLDWMGVDCEQLGDSTGKLQGLF